MNADLLMNVYDRVSDSPDAIPKLRRFILDLAMRGKLIPQVKESEPASALLARIERLKASVSNRKSGRQVQARSSNTGLGFAPPPNWIFTTLGEITLKITDGAHKTPTYVAEGVPFVSVKDFSGGRLDLSNTRLIPEREHKELYKRCDPKQGDILIGRIGTLGRAVIVDTNREFSLFVSVGLIRFDAQCIAPAFLKALLNSPVAAREFDRIKIGGGTHTNKLNLGDLHTVAVPLPPFAEQHRIIAKVDELMALCDQLENKGVEREAKRRKLTVSTLARLNASSSNSFRNDACFALDNLRALTTRPDQLDQLRHTIRNLAVRGRLLTQDPQDEPASLLLEKLPISKGGKPPRAVEPEYLGFPMPAGWALTRLGRVVLDSDAGWSPKTESHPRTGVKWGVLKVSAVSWNKFLPEENKEVLRGTVPRQQARVRKGDFLISRANTAELVARAVVVDSDPINLMMSDKIVRLSLVQECDPHYLLLVNNHADFSRAYYATEASGVSPSMKNVSRDVILSAPLPLPPLAEQHRIVAKVDQMISACDALELALGNGDFFRGALLDAVIVEALRHSEEPAELH